MRNISWNKSLSVEVDEIDDDHRKLIDLFNMLSRSVAAGDADDFIETLLEELISCTQCHFKHEERLMLLYKYRDMAGHKDEHDELMNSVNALRRKYHEQNRKLSDEDIEYLETWLTEHILGHDMRLGFYLEEVM